MKQDETWGSPWKRGLPRKFASFVQFCPVKKRTWKFARLVLFRPFKKRSFNLLCVLDLFFFQNTGSQLCFRLFFFFISLKEIINHHQNLMYMLKVVTKEKKQSYFSCRFCTHSLLCTFFFFQISLQVLTRLLKVHGIVSFTSVKERLVSVVIAMVELLVSGCEDLEQG